MTYDRIIHEESEGEEDESGVHRMADKGVGAICDERAVSSWFRDNTGVIDTMREQSGSSEEQSGYDESIGHDILWSEGLTDWMEEGEISK